MTAAVSLPSTHMVLHCSSSNGLIVPDTEPLRRFRQLRHRYQKGPEDSKRSAEDHTVTHTTASSQMVDAPPTIWEFLISCPK